MVVSIISIVCSAVRVHSFDLALHAFVATPAIVGQPLRQRLLQCEVFIHANRKARIFAHLRQLADLALCVQHICYTSVRHLWRFLQETCSQLCELLLGESLQTHLHIERLCRLWVDGSGNRQRTTGLVEHLSDVRLFT
jgi:hypothetical protein